MKQPHLHLLQVEEGGGCFAPLIQAAREAGMRVGWLELAGARPDPVPVELEQAEGAGVLRAVAVGEGRSVAVKGMRGAPVLRDVLREHFRGCALVLLRMRGGGIEVPEVPMLRADGQGWRVEVPGEAARIYETDGLVGELRRPHPWGVRGALPP